MKHILIASTLAAIVTANGAAACTCKVNVNTARAGDIQTCLTGIGEKKAAAIVAGRDKNGTFKTPDNLTRVKGIGFKTVEKNRACIVTDEKTGMGRISKKPEA